MSTAYVNQPSRPTEISTPHFVGRVTVFVKDFHGVTPDGSPPKPDAVYFEGRSRKFAILIEGKFRARAGVKPYSASEVQFGSDFGASCSLAPLVVKPPEADADPVQTTSPTRSRWAPSRPA